MAGCHGCSVLTMLVSCVEADVNARDHGGRRPVDMLNPKCVEKTKSELSVHREGTVTSELVVCAVELVRVSSEVVS